MKSNRKVCEDYPFRRDEHGMPYLPGGMMMEGELYVLPNGKLLPRGCYVTSDGGSLIYEPKESSPFADLLAGCTEK
ncbi:MAG: hypothetical protein PUJ78_03230 [Coriobacteriaceae bacterium]|nr:hypothetical protein [Coriobacteriaceae bacterium]